MPLLRTPPSNEAVPAHVTSRIKVNCRELRDFSMSPDGTVMATADPQKGSVSLWAVPGGVGGGGGGGGGAGETISSASSGASASASASGAAAGGSGGGATGVAGFTLTGMMRLPRACRVEWHPEAVLATAESDANVYLLPNSRGAKHVTLAGHTAATLCVCGTGLGGGTAGACASGAGGGMTGSLVLAGAQDGWARVWDAATRKVVMAYDCPATNSSSSSSAGSRSGLVAEELTRPGCTAAAFSCDGRAVALGYRNHALVVFDCRSRTQLLATRALHEDAVTSLCFAAGDGLLLSAGRDSCLRVLDLRLLGGGGGIGDSSFSFSSAEEAAGRAAEQALTLTCPGFKIGGAAAVTRACFSPDGQFAACGSQGGDVVVWDVQGAHAGRVVKKFRTHDAASVVSVCCWTGGGTLFAGDSNGTIARIA